MALALWLAACAATGGRAAPIPTPTPEPPAAPLAPEPVTAAAVAESLLAKGDLALDRGEADMALRCFREAEGAPAARARALYGEGRAYLALGRTEHACRVLRDAGDAADTTAAGRVLTSAVGGVLGQVYLQMGRTDAARQIFLDLARRSPDLRNWAAVMVGRTYQRDAAWHDAFAAIRPVLREGRYAPAYDLALALFWKLDAGAQQEMTRLLRGYLGSINHGVAGGGH